MCSKMIDVFDDNDSNITFPKSMRVIDVFGKKESDGDEKKE